MAKWSTRQQRCKELLVGIVSIDDSKEHILDQFASFVCFMNDVNDETVARWLDVLRQIKDRQNPYLELVP